MSRPKKTAIKSGRTIGEYREHLETASERASAHKKNKAKRNLRISITVLVFVLIAIGLVAVIVNVFAPKVQIDNEEQPLDYIIIIPYAPTIEVVDNASVSSDTSLTSRMSEYIGQAEADFRELGYIPTKAVIPAGSIREVDFYLEGYNGYIKMLIDRGTGVSVEDADLMIRYLAGIDVADFEYIDVRVERKAYWK